MISTATCSICALGQLGAGPRTRAGRRTAARIRNANSHSTRESGNRAIDSSAGLENVADSEHAANDCAVVSRPGPHRRTGRPELPARDRLADHRRHRVLDRVRVGTRTCPKRFGPGVRRPRGEPGHCESPAGLADLITRSCSDSADRPEAPMGRRIARVAQTGLDASGRECAGDGTGIAPNVYPRTVVRVACGCI